jgi:hypothetical protein
MATFPQLPDVKLLNRRDGVRIYQLVEPLYHYDGVVEAGFQSDGSSIPRLFWSIPGFAHDGPSLPAALVHDHDYLHSTGSRREADRRFLRNMRYTGLGLAHRYAIYRAVRMFAGATWRKYRAA